TLRLTAQADGRGELEPAPSLYVAAHHPGDGHVHSANVGGNPRVRTHQQLAPALDLALEAPQEMPVSPHLQVALEEVCFGQHRQRRLVAAAGRQRSHGSYISFGHQFFLYGLPTAAGAIARPIAPATTTMVRTYGSILKNWYGSRTPRY